VYPPASVKGVARETRLGLLVLAAVLFVVGLPLVLAPTRTDQWFAWTIEPPLTAATLGACYWGSLVLVVLCARERAWACARVAAPGILVAGTLLLVATLIHLDKFHMDSVTGWTWVVLYALLPPGAILMLVIQARVPGGDPPRRAPLPHWARGVLGVHAAVLLGLGAALFVAPGDVAPIWPWSLTPLTARAIAAWMLALGASAAQAFYERDWMRLRSPLPGYGALGALALLALARFSGTPEWGEPAAWIYVAFLVSMVAFAAYAGTAARRHPTGRTRPADEPTAATTEPVADR
jgi:hypothetical protein